MPNASVLEKEPKGFTSSFPFSFLQPGTWGFLKEEGIQSSDHFTKVTAVGSWLTIGFGFLGLLLQLYFKTPKEMFLVTTLSCIALGMVLLFENYHPQLRRAQRELEATGIVIAFLMSTDLFLSFLALWGPSWGNTKLAAADAWWGHLTSSPFSTLALSILPLCMAACPRVTQRPSKVGDFLGACTLFVMTGYSILFLSYLYNTPFFLKQRIVSPPLSSVAAILSLGVAVLGRLGPNYFPARPMVGSSVQAMLLRKFLPVTLASVFIYLLLLESLLIFFNPAFSTFLTLLLSLLTMTFLVSRSSVLVSSQLDRMLAETEQRYSHLVGALKDYGMLLLNKQGQILIWNIGAERLTGYTAAEVVKEQLPSRLFRLDKELKAAFQEAVRQGASLLQVRAQRKDGTLFWAEITISVLPDEKGHALGFSMVIRDFTERKKAEEKLQASLREKEIMFKEIHHRVKNNLQVISSLLRLQSEKSKDEDTLALFKDSQERVRAMSMVHEYLYQSPDLTRINFPGYCTSLVRNLCRTYGANSSESRMAIRVDPVLLNLDMAVPCGLILTELVSNALKYAYPDNQPGPISVSFRALPSHMYELAVQDEGVGLPRGLDWENSSSLGLRLVHILTEQLQGKIRLEQDKGTRFVVTFKETGG